MEQIINVNTVMCMPDGTRKETTQNILKENDIEVKVLDSNGLITTLHIVCTNTNIEEMIAGRLLCDGLISDKNDLVYICEDNGVINVKVNASEKISDKPQPVKKFKKVENNNIFEIINHFAKGSELHALTKSAHSCYLSVDGTTVFGCEDISRHNATDKVIGYILLNNIDPEDCILYTSGRVPLDMIEKIAAAGIPILVSKAVPTDKSIEFARENKIVLIARAREDHYEVFVG